MGQRNGNVASGESPLSVVEVSGEHPNLPVAEVLAVLRGLGQEPLELWVQPRIAAFANEVDLPGLVARLAFARAAGVVMRWGSLEDIQDGLASLDLRGKRFRLRVDDHLHAHAGDLEVQFGGLLATTGTVDLETPEVDLRLVRGRRAYLYAVSAEVNRGEYDARAARNRPFARPFVLHPRYARALVNLTGVAPGETLLDPFCGTGGILMEAALVGATPIGADIRPDVVEGCRQNLEHFGLEAALHVADVGDALQEGGRVHAIATDPPYGRGASTRGEDLDALLRRAFRTFHQVLRPGGRVALPLPDPELMDLGRGDFTLQEWHKVRVHGSLDRYFCLFRRR
ncbi:MAG: methyltransferase domain-containing protein [Thermoplasmata archaeon]